MMSNLKRYIKYKLFSLLYRNRKTLLYANNVDQCESFINNEDRRFGDFRKIIWTYWEGDTVPILVIKCIEKIRQLNPSYKLVMLNQDNLSEYLPDFDCKDVDMPIANKTDLLRLELLYKYGGIWMDATVILNENLEWLNPLIEKNIYDCIAFKRDSSTIEPRFPVIESWFLCARSNSPFIKSWLDELRPLGEIGSQKFFVRLKERSDYDKIRQNIDRPNYLLVYLTQQIVMQRDQDFNVYLQSAEKTAFFYQESLNWDMRQMNIEFMIKTKRESVPSIIKLISGNAQDISFCYKHNLINKKSIVGEILYGG